MTWLESLVETRISDWTNIRIREYSLILWNLHSLLRTSNNYIKLLTKNYIKLPKKIHYYYGCITVILVWFDVIWHTEVRIFCRTNINLHLKTVYLLHLKHCSLGVCLLLLRLTYTKFRILQLPKQLIKNNLIQIS